MSFEFQVDLPDQVDIAGSLELFRRSGDDLIDRWDGCHLVRAVPVAGHAWAPFAARQSASGRTGFSVCVNDPGHAPAVARAVADTFVSAPADYPRLLGQDPILAALDQRRPGIRQIRQLDVFTALIRCISAQQVNLRWAVITRRRLAEAFGRACAIGDRLTYALDPERIASVDPADIRALQFTTSKSVSIVATARAVVDQDLSVDALGRLDDEAVIQRLIGIRGIGRWSAEWVLARTLGRPRVVAGDLGVRKAVGLAYRPPGAAVPSEAEVRAATAHWGPSAGVAQAVLLHALGEGWLTAQEPPGSRAASRR